MSRREESTRPGAAADAQALRIDKWLWCTRFYKTRGLAQQAVDGGQVQINGERVKSARAVRVGERVRITRERERMELDVLGIPARRGPAGEARYYYAETEESIAARARQHELNRLSMAIPIGRPDKRARRELLRLRGRGAPGPAGASGEPPDEPD